MLRMMMRIKLSIFSLIIFLLNYYYYYYYPHLPKVYNVTHYRAVL